ncbi:hypothetical protein CYY_000748 [Polysphondylium violaceum]|uniref:Uncharacterized protein n=1 Tax=Polysphondylium violaceum TaxID=133409 RepID=A0A8J4Q387_9MYCE|nr:hypothetical protein CYY_000748 [Polysphondylium violaceum]
MSSIHPGDKQSTTSVSSNLNEFELDAKKAKVEAQGMVESLAEGTQTAIDSTKNAINSGITYVTSSLQPVLDKTKEMGAATMEKLGEATNNMVEKSKELLHNTQDATSNAIEKCQHWTVESKDAICNKCADLAESAKNMATHAKDKNEAMLQDAKKNTENAVEKCQHWTAEQKDAICNKCAELNKDAKKMAGDAKDKMDHMAGDAKDKMDHMATDAKDKAAELNKDAKKMAGDAKDKMDHMATDAKDKAAELNKDASKKAAEAKDKMGEMATDAKKKADSLAADAKDKGENMAETIRHATQDGMEKCQHWTAESKDAICKGCKDAADNAKTGIDKAADAIKDTTDDAKKALNNAADEVEKKASRGRGRPKKN